MYWNYEGGGEWSAESKFHDSGLHFRWIIGVCDDGTFAVNESDRELTTRKETFDSLQLAKDWCNEQERQMLFSAQAKPYSHHLP